MMAMPMDAYRKDDSFLIRLDLPGVHPDSIDLTVEENVLTVKAERPVPGGPTGLSR
jgi:HSP20 family protein